MLVDRADTRLFPWGLPRAWYPPGAPPPGGVPQLATWSTSAHQLFQGACPMTGLLPGLRLLLGQVHAAVH